eukprot:2009086-Alexandrium_andersonii.AAC.1
MPLRPCSATTATDLPKLCSTCGLRATSSGEPSFGPVWSAPGADGIPYDLFHVCLDFVCEL